MIGDDFLNRFGLYRLQPYAPTLYTGPPVGGPPGTQIGGTVTSPVVTPPAGGGGSGSGGGGNGGTINGGGSGSGSNGTGNAGGASHGVGGGGAGDNAGHPGTNADGSRAASSTAGFDGGLFGTGGNTGLAPYGQVDMTYLGPILSALGLAAPGAWGAIPGAINAGLNLSNMAGLDTGLTAAGFSDPISGWQYAGSTIGGGLLGLLGLGNPMGQGTDAARNYAVESARERYAAGDTTYTNPAEPGYQVAPYGATQHQPMTLAAANAEAGLAPDGTPVAKAVKAPDGTRVLKDGTVQANGGAIVGAMVNGSFVRGATAGSAQTSGGNNGVYNAGANVGFGAGNYASTTGAPSGPAITSGGGSSGFYARGGWIPGDPRMGDTMPISTTPGEFVVNRDSAQRAPGLLGLVNSSPLAAHRLDEMVRGGGWHGGLFGAMFGGRGRGLLRDGRFAASSSFGTPLRGSSG